jgi:hypothetical protein
MLRTLRRTAVLMAAVTGVLVLTSAANASTASLPHFGAKVCRNGDTLRSGSYASLTVKGLCTLGNHADAVIRGNVVVGRNGLFNAITHGHLVVWGETFVRSGGAAGVGCSPAAGCNVTTHDRFHGDVIAAGASAMIFHSDRIDGRVDVRGGGGGDNCNNSPIGGPWFTTFEDNSVGGNLSVRLMQGCWLGLFRNHVAGNVRVNNNTFADPDADEIQTNVIAGNLTCFGNTPAPQRGDSGGTKNIVAGEVRGQCRKVV